MSSGAFTENGSNATVDITEVVEALRFDLDRVEERLKRAASVDFPLAGELLQTIISSGGKRLRPILLILACKSFTWNAQLVVPAAAGVEMLHTASLVHDDTIDHALVRRGEPTLNSMFDTETVILLGDYLFAQSAILATETMNPSVVAVFASTLADICDGQLQEIFNSRSVDQTPEHYERRIFGKTASLFAGSAEMGAIIGGASDEQKLAMRNFGADIGMAFQIVDDVLDLRSTSEELGKPVGLDLREGTLTLPAMLFLRNSDGSGPANLVRRIVRGDDVSDQDVTAVATLIGESSAIEESLDRAYTYVDRAKSRLRSVQDPLAVKQLAALADYAVQRLH